MIKKHEIELNQHELSSKPFYLLPWIQDVNIKYSTCLEDVLYVFWTFYVHSVCVLGPGRSNMFDL